MSVEERIQGLLGSLGTRVDAAILQDADELLRGGEWGVAFEALCDSVYETEVPLFDGEIREFEIVGQYLSSVSPFPDRGVWKMLKQLRADDAVGTFLSDAG